MRRHIPTSLFAVAVTLGVSFAASSGFAQSISDEDREEAVDEDTRQSADERLDDQTERLDRGETEADVEKGPSMDKEDVERQRLSKKEIEKTKEKLEEKNREMIQKLDKLIQEDPQSPNRPNWMFRKAELMWELRNMEYLRKRAEYNQCLKAARQGTQPKSKCSEPDPQYEDAQKIYKKVLQQYPDYDRLDEVLYRLGQGLMEAGKNAQGVSYLQRLVTNYKNSKYIPNANLSLAEHFFENGNLGASENKYKRVLDFPKNPNYNYALYKLGWVHYNQSRYRETIDTFKKVVEKADGDLGFEDQAINDMVMAYAEVEDGWKEMRDYFMKKRDEKFTYDKLGDLASLYESQGKNQSAIAVYRYFIDERSNHRKVPNWMESIVQARKKIGKPKKTEKAINEFVSYLSEGGTWWKKNDGNDGARTTATKFKKASLAFLAKRYHKKGQENDDGDAYANAATYYEKYIERFPEDPASFDMNFFLGDIYLLKIDRFKEAATHYQKVVDLYKNDNVPKEAEEKEIRSMVRDAAYGVVNVYNELVKEKHEDSILVKMAEYAEKHPGETYQAKDKKKKAPDERERNERVELLEWEKKFVKASDQYSELFPDTDVTPTVDFVAAEVYKARGHYKECIARYENIIENAPDHRYASFAGNSLLQANYVLDRWKDVEKWARHLMENEIFDITPKESLKEAIAFAINKQAQELKENDEGIKAADKLLALAEEFPESELAPGAMYNAAVYYSKADKVDKTVKYFKQVIDDYPEDEKAPAAIFQLGSIAESRANFGKAASYFARLGQDKTYHVKEEKEDGEGQKKVDKKYYEHPKAADAVYNAAQLRRAMEKWSKAVETFEKYIETFPDRDDIRSVKLRLAYLEKKRDNPEKALERFRSFAERDDIEPEEKVELATEIGVLLQKTKPDDWKETSAEKFKTAYKTWNKELGKEQKQKTRNYAGRARFEKAERIYQKFKGVELEFPMSTLKERMKEKSKKLNKAEKIYLQVNETKSPRWASAASYRIGQMYDTFYQALYDLPMPDRLSTQQKMKYRRTLDNRIRPLQEKAVKAYNTAWKLALKLRAYNEWSRKSASKISELQSQSFPIKQQRGVATGHGTIRFYTPEPMTNFKVAMNRQEARWEELKEKRRKRRKKRKKQKEKEKEDKDGDEPDDDSSGETPAQAEAGN